MSSNYSYHVVPWFNKSELLLTRDQIMSTNQMDRKLALETLTCWNGRRSDEQSITLPLEVSTNLLRALLLDDEMTQRIAITKASTNEEQQLVAASLGMALIRFTALVQAIPSQNTKQLRSFQTEELAMSDRMQAMGIPTWVSDVRNSLTHHGTPSIELLRNACAVAMEHLKVHFWSVLPQLVDDVIGQTPNAANTTDNTVARIDELLTNYMDARLKGEATPSMISELTDCNRFELAKILATKGYLVLRFDQLEQFDIDGAAIINDNKPNLCKLPIELEQLWTPVLALFNSNATLQCLMECLIGENCDPDDIVSNWLCSCWISLISDCITSNEQFNNNAQFRFAGVTQLDWYSLVGIAMKRPHKYTCAMLKKFFKQMKIDVCLESHLLSLVAIQCRATLSEHNLPKKTKKVFSLDDLKPIFEEIKRNKQEEQVSEGPWSVASHDIPWKDIPLGADIPQQYRKGGSMDDIFLDNMSLTDEQFFPSQLPNEEQSTLAMDDLEEPEETSKENKPKNASTQHLNFDLFNI